MLRLRWLGQSGYLLSDGITTVCIDPYLSDCVNRIAGRPRTRAVPVAPEALQADAVICTHNHLDHLDVDAIPQMNKDMLFLAPKDCEDALKALGITNFQAFDEGQSLKIGAFRLTAVFAHHTVPAIGVQVFHNGQSLYFSGDTLLHENLEQIKCDYLFVCINGRLGNMDVQQASYLSERIHPKLAVPNHYDMFESNSEDPEKFKYEHRFIMEFNKEYEVSCGCLI